jgi:hypothetical protein
MRQRRIPRTRSQPGAPSTFVWVGVDTSMPPVVSAIGRMVGPSSMAGAMSDVEGLSRPAFRQFVRNRFRDKSRASPEHHRAYLNAAAGRRIGRTRRIFECGMSGQTRAAVGGGVVHLEESGFLLSLARIPIPAVAWTEGDPVSFAGPIGPAPPCCLEGCDRKAPLCQRRCALTAPQREKASLAPAFLMRLCSFCVTPAAEPLRYSRFPSSSLKDEVCRAF